MDDHTRRAIAFIVGKILVSQYATAVFDSGLSKHFAFNGQISGPTITVHDPDDGCFISGSGRDGLYTLFHCGMCTYIELRVLDKAFKGYDYATRKQFSGTVVGTSIQFIDDEHSAPFTYTIVS